MVIWLSGNSGAGKTTLAKTIQKIAKDVVILDGDEMRESISSGLSFSREDRIENNIRTAKLAKVIQAQGKTVIVASIAPYKEGRDIVDSILNVQWVYLMGGKSGPDYPYEPPGGAA